MEYWKVNMYPLFYCKVLSSLIIFKDVWELAFVWLFQSSQESQVPESNLVSREVKRGDSGLQQRQLSRRKCCWKSQGGLPGGGCMADLRALVPSRDCLSGCTHCLFLVCFSVPKCKQTNIISNSYNLVSDNPDFFDYHSVLSETGHTGPWSLPSRKGR